MCLSYTHKRARARFCSCGYSKSLNNGLFGLIGETAERDERGVRGDAGSVIGVGNGRRTGDDIALCGVTKKLRAPVLGDGGRPPTSDEDGAGDPDTLVSSDRKRALNDFTCDFDADIASSCNAVNAS